MLTCSLLSTAKNNYSLHVPAEPSCYLLKNWSSNPDTNALSFGRPKQSGLMSSNPGFTTMPIQHKAIQVSQAMTTQTDEVGKCSFSITIQSWRQYHYVSQASWKSSPTFLIYSATTITEIIPLPLVGTSNMFQIRIYYLCSHPINTIVISNVHISLILKRMYILVQSIAL